MDLRQLRYFVGIVQAGSLSRAADQMHVAQSAISHHLARLESELERQLVTRSPKGIELTEAGSVLYRHSESILRHLEFAKQDAMSTLEAPSGRVCFGFPGVLAPLLCYELLKRVRTAYPNILLQLTEANGWLLRERLVNGRLDIALLYLAEPQRGLAVEPLASEELFYCTADPDPSPIRVAQVVRRPLLLATADSNSRQVAEKAFGKHGVTVSPVAEMDTIGTLRRAIAAGMGDSIMPWSALYDGEKKVALTCRRFADAKLVRPVALCFPEQSPRSPAIQAVALTLKSLVRELIEAGVWEGVSLIVPAERETTAAETTTDSVTRIDESLERPETGYLAPAAPQPIDSPIVPQSARFDRLARAALNPDGGRAGLQADRETWKA